MGGCGTLERSSSRVRSATTLVARCAMLCSRLAACINGVTAALAAVRQLLQMIGGRRWSETQPKGPAERSATGGAASSGREEQQ